MKRRKVTSSSDTKTARSRAALKNLACACGRVIRVDYETVSVICDLCVQKKVGIDAKYLRPSAEKAEKKAATGFPRGWHLYKQFVHPDGKVFEYGVEKPELKGTLPVTQVKVNTMSKFERRKKREEKELRKMKRLAKLHKRKQKGEI